MRVEKSRMSRTPQPEKGRVARSSGFEASLEEKQEDLYRKSVEEKLREVDEAASSLKEMLSEESVKTYQEKVKAFVEHAIAEAYRLLPVRRFDRRGKQKMMMLRDTVNQRIETLIDLFLKEHGPYLKILRLLDEIRGLLIDLII